MRKTLGLIPAFVLSAVACAKSPGPPSRMPREKALVVQTANLQQQALAAQVRELQRQVNEAESALKPALAERDGILKDFGIRPEDFGKTVKINFSTGEIERAPAPKLVTPKAGPK